MMTLNSLQKNLQYDFNDETLLLQALTHRSKHIVKNNERLEFLGDSVLGLVISTELYSRHEKIREGELSRLRAALVKGETIAKIAQALDIGSYLQLGAGEQKSGGSARESILAGAFEAIIGAIYCDANFETAQACVLRWYGHWIEEIDMSTDVKDAKTTLQEWTQAKKMSLPNYEVRITGHAHKQQFDVVCRIEGLTFESHGRSTNRRKAEQLAAKDFLKLLDE